MKTRLYPFLLKNGHYLAVFAKSGQWARGVWHSVVGKVRFLLMGKEYLEERRILAMVSGEDREWLVGVNPRGGGGGAGPGGAAGGSSVRI